MASCCWACGLSLSNGEYIIGSRKTINSYLLTHPEWHQKEGIEFNESSQLCIRKKCLAISFESWRLETFGIKSPRNSVSAERREIKSQKISPELDNVSLNGSVTFENDPKQWPALEETASVAVPSIEQSSSKAEMNATVQPHISYSEQESKDAYDRIMRNKLEAVSNITHESISDSIVAQISQKLHENRDERLRIAKRVNDKSASSGDRSKRERDLQKEVALLNKRDLYEKMMDAKSVQEDAQNKFNRIEREQNLAALKLEGVARKKQVQLDSLQTASAVFDANTTLSNILNENTGNLLSHDENYASVKHALQLALREAYIKKKEGILSKRKQLIAGRFQLEARLEELRLSLRPEAIVTEDEPFLTAFSLAENMPDSVQEAIVNLNQRVVNSAVELDWLEVEPDSINWSVIKTRLEEEDCTAQVLQEINENLQKFQKGIADRSVLDVAEKSINYIESASLHVAEKIILEYLIMSVRTVCEDQLAIISVCQLAFDQALLHAATRTDSRDVELMRVSGREFLYLGAMNDLRAFYYNELSPPPTALDSFEWMGSIPAAKYEVTPSILYTDFKQGGKLFSTQWEANATKGVMPATEHIDSENIWLNDYIARQVLVDCENKHWSKISLVASRGSPILLPSIPGHICCMRLFSHAVCMSSLLLVGTNYGQLVVYGVPWTGACPLTLSVTPQLQKKNQSPVTEIRESATNALQFISMTENGHIKVWNLAAIPNSNNHSSRMFPTAVSNFEMLVVTCVFHINPADMSVPVPLGQVDRNGKLIPATKTSQKKKKPKKSALGMTAFDEEESGFSLFGTKVNNRQPEMFPSCVAFHSSMTFLGRNPSIVVGTKGGDLLKFNMDFKIDALDAPIAYLPAFLNIEYVHPINSPDTILQTFTGRKGNQVYRELFHYHKSKVILMTAVNRLSDVIFTMDENLSVALWKYQQSEFRGMCWFKPFATTQLDLTSKAIIHVGETLSVHAEPSAQLLSELTVRSRHSDDTGATIEIFNPIKVGSQYIEYQSRTSIYKNTKVKSAGTTETFAMEEEEEVVEKSWTSSVIRELVMHSRVEKTVLSSDGTELAIAISFRKAPNAMVGASYESIALSGYKNFISIISFHLETLEYQRPFPEFEIDANDSFLSLSLSPVLSETLTRVCLIQTRLTGVRVFSMETGEEVVTGAFPFLPRFPSFDPSIFVSCPSLRVVAFGGPQDSRIYVYVLLHEDDGKDTAELKESQLLTPQVLRALRKDYRVLESMSTRTVLATPPVIDTPEVKEAKEVTHAIMMQVLDLVMDGIQNHIEEQIKLAFISDVYGRSDGLGSVEPTVWPLDHPQMEGGVDNLTN